MITLDATNRSLEIVLTGAITTNQLQFTAFWVDRTSSTYTPGATVGITNNTTPVTIVSAPGASTQRIIKYITLFNADTVSAVAIFRYNDNSSIRQIQRIPLGVNDTFEYGDTTGLNVINSNAEKKSSLSLISSIPAGNNNIGDIDVLTLPGIQGDIANDGVDSGNPLKIGGIAKTADIAAVANNDRVQATFDKFGKQVILIGALPELLLNGKGTFSNITAADIIAAQGAGLRVAVTSILVTNAHATTGTKVEIRDGTTVIIQGFASANGGGFSYNSSSPLFKTTANTAVTARCVTTGADVDVSCSGYIIGN